MSPTHDGKDPQGPSTRPYLIRALHDWCTDNGYTPYLAVYVDASVQVPQDYVKNNEIVLNVSFDATSQLVLGNEHVEFQARFGGVARVIRVPVDHVIAIYSRENGQGMAFPMPTQGDGSGSAVEPVLTSTLGEGPDAERGAQGPRLVPLPTAGETPADPPPGGPTAGGGRPALKRVK